MATVIKAWTTTVHEWEEREQQYRRLDLHVVAVSCGGGSHFHLYTSHENKYATLEELDFHLTEAMTMVTAHHGNRLVWTDATNEYGDDVITTTDKGE